jgi:hypothetical protein
MNKQQHQQQGAAGNEHQHTTHPQPHEQLLMGWVMGGTPMTREQRGKMMMPLANMHSLGFFFLII